MEEGPATAPTAPVVEALAATALTVTLSAELATNKVQAGDTWDGVMGEDVGTSGKPIVFTLTAPERVALK